MIYFVATPIGNLKDITIRALEILESVDVIACEDTRNSLKLLNHYNIKKKLIAYHKFNENNSSDGIIKLAKEGKNIAIISDAGMPVISDPGQILIQKLQQNNIDYTVIPGASASLSALLLSGMDSSSFTFVGFLDEQNKKRKKQVDNIKDSVSTLIFYVSPYNIQKDIQYLFEQLGNRKACLVNEITKVYEKKIHFCLGELPQFERKGEYVLVVEGAMQVEEKITTSPKQELEILLSSGTPKNDAIKQVAKMFGIKKNDVYQLTVKD